MARDGESIPTIFHPRKVRAPSVVVTGDSPNGPFGGFTTGANNPTSPSAQVQQHPPPITHSDSVASSEAHGSADHPQTPRGDTPMQGQQLALIQPPVLTQTERSRLQRCRDSCCSSGAQKVNFYLGNLSLLTSFRFRCTSVYVLQFS